MSGISVHVLQRRVDGFDLKPGEYRQPKRGSRLAGVAHAVVCCPSCSRLTLTTKMAFAVTLEGVVEPAIICPYSCGFSGALVLDEWIPEAKGDA